MTYRIGIDIDRMSYCNFAIYHLILDVLQRGCIFISAIKLDLASACNMACFFPVSIFLKINDILIENLEKYFLLLFSSRNLIKKLKHFFIFINYGHGYNKYIFCDYYDTKAETP